MPLTRGARSSFLSIAISILSAISWVHAGDSVIGDVRIEMLTPTVQTDPRTATHLMARFHNPATEAVELEPLWSLPQGWRWVVPPSTLHVPAAGEATSVVTFLVPLEWPAGQTSVELRAAPGGEVASAEVHVNAHSEVRVELLSAPSPVIHEPYTLRFLISNGGNQAERLRLAVSHDARFGVALDAAEVLDLPAGAAIIVTAEVRPPVALDRRTFHTVRLEVSREPPGSGALSARARVEVLPLALQTSPRHHYDLRLRLTAGAELDLGTDQAWAAGSASSGVELRGSGWLDPEGNRHLAIDARVDPSDIGGGRVTVHYRSEDVDITAGHQTVRFTPLLHVSKAFGVIFRTEQTLPVSWALATHAAILSEQGRLLLGTHASLSYMDRAILGLTAALPVGDPPMLGARLQLRSDLGPFLSAGLDAEVLTRGPGSLSTRAALDIDASPATFSVRWVRHVLPTAEVRSDLSLRAGLRLPAAVLADTPWRYVQYSAWFDRRDRSPTTASWSTQWGVSGTFRAERVTTTARYTQRYTESTGRVRREFRVQMRLPFADGLDLTPRLTWDHGSSDLSWGRPALDLTGTLRFSSAGGRGSLRVGLGFVQQQSHPKLEAAWRWRAEFTPTFRLTSGVDLRLTPQVSVGVEALAEIGLTQDRGLEIGLAAQFRPDAPTTWRGHLALSLPISIALGAAGPTGGLEGRVVDDDGGPVVGARIRLADQVAVTDADGVYRFAALPLGEHYLSLVLPDAYTDRFIQPALPWGLVVEADAFETADFHLARPAALAVHLAFDPTLSGALPSLEGITLRIHGPRQSHVAVTDAQGAVRLGGLEPGNYRVEVEPRRVPMGYRLRLDSLMLEALPGETVEQTLFLRSIVDERRIVDGGMLGAGQD